MADSLVDIFEQTAARFPDKVAVACREERYTFAELWDTARRLGQRIADAQRAAQTAGQPGDAASAAGQPAPIGVLVDRGADTAVYFLAVLSSGHFYVPIDPDLPREKMKKMFADADFSVVLCDEARRAMLREMDFAGTILTLADAGSSADPALMESNTGERCAASEPAAPFSPDTPAYMIYTSGSTGQPKGVVKSHGAVIDFMTAYIARFGLGPEKVIGNQTPFFFDASAKDFYLMLFTGATLEVLPTELFALPVTLVDYMNERHISYICWVPSALTVVTQLNTFTQAIPADLTDIFFVGETMPVKHLNQWMEALPNARYVNLYGSTEMAGVCCACELAVPFDGEEIPIGQPLSNARVFLREAPEDTAVSPASGSTSPDDVPRFITQPNVTGEICVASDALALEYYHDPQRTAEAFPTISLPDGSAARVLRTGDLARYNAEGDLVFAARRDDQIKHMGHRIELGEIETAAMRLPEMARCSCVYDERKNRICLFCELTPGCDWDRKAVRHALQSRLSEYMLPSKYIMLDEIPLNANGKADRVHLKEML